MKLRPITKMISRKMITRNKFDRLLYEFSSELTLQQQTNLEKNLDFCNVIMKNYYDGFIKWQPTTTPTNNDKKQSNY